METLTLEQVQDIVIYGTLGMLFLVALIIGLMVLANRRDMQYQKELDELRARLIKQTPKEQSEWLQISGGRKILRNLPQPPLCKGCGVPIGYCDCPVNGHLNKHCKQ